MLCLSSNGVACVVVVDAHIIQLLRAPFLHSRVFFHLGILWGRLVLVLGFVRARDAHSS